MKPRSTAGEMAINIRDAVVQEGVGLDVGYGAVYDGHARVEDDVRGHLADLFLSMDGSRDRDFLHAAVSQALALEESASTREVDFGEYMPIVSNEDRETSDTALVRGDVLVVGEKRGHGDGESSVRKRLPNAIRMAVHGVGSRSSKDDDSVLRSTVAPATRFENADVPSLLGFSDDWVPPPPGECTNVDGFKAWLSSEFGLKLDNVGRVDASSAYSGILRHTVDNAHNTQTGQIPRSVWLVELPRQPDRVVIESNFSAAQRIARIAASKPLGLLQGGGAVALNRYHAAESVANTASAAQRKCVPVVKTFGDHALPSPFTSEGERALFVFSDTQVEDLLGAEAANEEDLERYGDGLISTGEEADEYVDDSEKMHVSARISLEAVRSIISMTGFAISKNARLRCAHRALNDCVQDASDFQKRVDEIMLQRTQGGAEETQSKSRAIARELSLREVIKRSTRVLLISAAFHVHVELASVFLGNGTLAIDKLRASHMNLFTPGNPSSASSRRYVANAIVDIDEFRSEPVSWGDASSVDELLARRWRSDPVTRALARKLRTRKPESAKSDIAKSGDGSKDRGGKVELAPGSRDIPKGFGGAWLSSPPPPNAVSRGEPLLKPAPKHVNPVGRPVRGAQTSKRPRLSVGQCALNALVVSPSIPRWSSDIKSILPEWARLSIESARTRFFDNARAPETGSASRDPSNAVAKSMPDHGVVIQAIHESIRKQKRTTRKGATALKVATDENRSQEDQDWGEAGDYAFPVEDD